MLQGAAPVQRSTPLDPEWNSHREVADLYDARIFLCMHLGTLIDEVEYFGQIHSVVEAC
jgi:hypothetical protein